MSDEPTIVEDPATPVTEVLQRDIVSELDAIPVVVQGAVQVIQLPNRKGVTTVEYLFSTRAVRVLGADPRRAVAQFISATAWQYLDRQNGVACPVSANAVWTIGHQGEVWASVASGSEVALTVHSEYWAD